MERGRKTKVITIIALVVAIVTMSLGFAVFSNVLTISSSATVKPNEDEFKMKAYGIVDFYNVPEDLSDLSQFTSDTRAVALGMEGTNINATDAIINNSNSKNITISNLSVNFSGTGQEVQYGFFLKNEGSYNAYIDFSELNFNDDDALVIFPSSCSGGDGATPELVTAACNGVSIYAQFMKYSFYHKEFVLVDVESINEIAPGEFLGLSLLISYENGSVLADGPFTVNFDDIVLNFTSNASSAAE